MNEETRSADWTRHWAFASKFGFGSDRIDANAYTSPEVFEAEREKIFRKSWIPVVRESEVAEPGDYVLREVHPLKTDAIVVRGKDGTLRAFYNTCRHRGTALVTECQGTTSAFVCPYHAWTYGLDGKLRGLPAKAHFPQVETGKTGLRPIHLDTWNGFVFLNFDDEPESSLADFLGELGRMFNGLPCDDYPHVLEFTWDIGANWKTLMEASNEAYHVSVLHKWTLGEQLTSSGNPINNAYDAVFSPPHATATIESNVDYQPNLPVLNFVYSVEAFRGPPGGANREAGEGEPASFMAHPGVNRIGLPSMSAETILLFPFTCIQVLANRYIWFQYWPVAVDKTRFVLRVYLQSAPTSYREAFAEAHMAAYTRDIASEDGCMTAMQQRGFTSGGISEVVLGDNECVLRFFHDTIAQYLAK